MAAVHLPDDDDQRAALVARLMAPNDTLDDLPDIAQLLARPAWHARAACRGHPHAEWWFPERGDPPSYTTRAQAVCATCPVLDACRTYADGHSLAALHGTWAGLTGRGRRTARSRSAPAA